MARRLPSPQERAILGLAWAARGLLGFLITDLATVLGLLLLIPLYNVPTPSLYQTGQLEAALGLLSAGLLALAAASGLLYGVGLAGLYEPREKLGPAQAASAKRALRWLEITLLLFASEAVVPSLTGPLLAFPGFGYAPPSWAWSVSVTLAGLRAIFAGLTLYYAVQALAEEDERVRLLLGMSLGVVGATAWSGLAAYAAEVGVASAGSLLPFLAGAVAGLGTSAISLALFTAVYREIRRDLVARLPRAA